MQHTLSSSIVLTSPVLGLDPAVIAVGFESNGQQANPNPGQVPSLTSSNNFINFCLTVPDKPITNGLQTANGSCNPAPQGVLAGVKNMPSSKFIHPTNFGAIQANTTFEISMAVRHLQTGYFVNPDTNYYAAPQQVNKDGDIIGHTHFVVQQLDSFTSTTVLDPTVFAFFKGLSTAADENGIVAVNLTGGLPEGTYKVSSINVGANHQPVLVSVAQHGTLDDHIYFEVTANGQSSRNQTARSRTIIGNDTDKMV
ncbi:hypothetical protein BGW80DRAFT_1218639 [Lactifluus volemus]|nr:hypothetical protein BGW80DRAFT_1218639 [Lactifluus volemus]